jgi:hypothetical protein
MNTKYLLLTGHVPAIHPAAMVLFIAFMLMSLLLKKAFCSWLCPVGTLSELLWTVGRKVFGRNLRLPKWLDIPLRGLKYLLLGFFVFVIGAMSAEAVHDFIRSGRRRQDAEFLPRHRANHGHRHRAVGAALDAGTEFLVPVSLSVWCAFGARFVIQSRKDSPGR